MPAVAQTTNAVTEGCSFFDTYAVTLRNGKLEQTDALAALRARGYVVIHVDDLPPDFACPVMRSMRREQAVSK